MSQVLKSQNSDPKRKIAFSALGLTSTQHYFSAFVNDISFVHDDVLDNFINLFLLDQAFNICLALHFLGCEKFRNKFLFVP